MASFNDIKFNLKRHFADYNKAIFILSILFGISSWVVFAGIWVESTLLVKSLPESWTIPSMIGAVAQLGQIGPIMLYLLKCEIFALCPGKFLKIRNLKVPDRIIIYALFTIGLVSCACLSLFWDRTFYFYGKVRSIPFFVSVFFLAILDCTCTIVFLTYIGRFKENYVTALYIGEGISSLLPSLFSLAQGIGDEESCDNSSKNSQKTLNTTIPDNFFNTTSISISEKNLNPNFSVSVYFWLLFLTLLVSFVSFVLLDILPCFRKHKIQKNKLMQKNNDEQTQTTLLKNVEKNFIDKENPRKFKEPKKESKYGKALLLFGITTVGFLLYGFIPGLSSYSSLPYGSKVMHLSVTLALVTQPLSSLIATFIQIKSIKKIYFLLIISLAISFYIFGMSLMSPCPLLKDTWTGGVLMTLCWISVYAILMYLRCCITSALKMNYGEGSLMACGFLTQIGQFIGSILVYALVDVLNIFKEANSCDNSNC